MAQEAAAERLRADWKVGQFGDGADVMGDPTYALRLAKTAANAAVAALPGGWNWVPAPAPTFSEQRMESYAYARGIGKYAR